MYNSALCSAQICSAFPPCSGWNNKFNNHMSLGSLFSLFYFWPPSPPQDFPCTDGSHGNGTLGMKGNHNFVAGLIWRHERCRMKFLSKPLLILFIACRFLRNLFPLWRFWFDSPVVLDLVPPWYLWHVDIKWFPRQAVPIFQSPLSRGYSPLAWTGESAADKQTFGDTTAVITLENNQQLFPRCLRW